MIYNGISQLEQKENIPLDANRIAGANRGVYPMQERDTNLPFTPGQLRSTVGLSLETFRHWKRVLPPFSERRGRAPLFSIGDLLAACILRRLTDEAGMRVGHLTRISKEIVRICNSLPWAALEGKILVVDLIADACSLATDQRSEEIPDVTVLCKLAPIMTELRDALLRSQPSASQAHFLFPPNAVADDQTRRSRA
jgi:hypothetical protein